jgi:hypothetical protein
MVACNSTSAAGITLSAIALEESMPSHSALATENAAIQSQRSTNHCSSCGQIDVEPASEARNRGQKGYVRHCVGRAPYTLQR